MMRAGLAVLMALLAAAPAAAEVKEVNISYHPGVGYLTGPIMSHEKLVEKHAERLGVGKVAASYRISGGATQSMELVVSGTVDFAIAGLTPVIIAWAKTKGEILGVAAANTADLVLVSNQERIRSVADFTPNDRIAVPAVKSSMQAIALAMAAEKTFGDAKKLDPITVSMQHPDAVAAILSRKSEITAHFASPPFFVQELKDPAVHKITTMEEILGGPASIAAMIARVKFRRDNPKVFQAVFDALGEANEFIAKNPRRAALIYVTMAKSKLGVEDVEQEIRQNRYTLTPTGVMKFADFMHRAGMIPQRPTSWKEIFFDTVHHLPGN
ncbi:MAG TPA: ABC transporter substrate-binding protein [Methylomirabilota bacterium]|jgi:NitT/TauT family transport system substrate-binding protein|nr:ABC transporter substrate-binding protein [Methylomirabilota bacterium]